MLFLNTFAGKRENLRAWTLCTKEVISRYHSKRWPKDFVKMCLMIRIISKDVDEIRNTTIGVGDINPHPPPPFLHSLTPWMWDFIDLQYPFWDEFCHHSGRLFRACVKSRESPDTYIYMLYYWAEERVNLPSHLGTLEPKREGKGKEKCYLKFD